MATAMAPPLYGISAVSPSNGGGVPIRLICEKCLQGLVCGLIEKWTCRILLQIWSPRQQNLPDASRKAQYLENMASRGLGMRVGSRQQVFSNFGIVSLNEEIDEAAPVQADIVNIILYQSISRQHPAALPLWGSSTSGCRGHGLGGRTGVSGFRGRPGRTSLLPAEHRPVSDNDRGRGGRKNGDGATGETPTPSRLRHSPFLGSQCPGTCQRRGHQVWRGWHDREVGRGSCFIGRAHGKAGAAPYPA
jgi:hypothetical protein